MSRWSGLRSGVGWNPAPDRLSKKEHPADQAPMRWRWRSGRPPAYTPRDSQTPLRSSHQTTMARSMQAVAPSG